MELKYKSKKILKKRRKKTKKKLEFGRFLGLTPFQLEKGTKLLGFRLGKGFLGGGSKVPAVQKPLKKKKKESYLCSSVRHLG